MRRRRVLIIGAVVLVLLLGSAGAAAWYVFGGDEAPPPPTLPSATGPRPTTGSPDGDWTLRRGTGFVGYRIEELFAGETLHKTAVGRTKKLSGTLVIGANQVQSVTVTADMTELESDRAPRDSYLRDHALETDRYSKATFELTAPAALPAPKPSGEPIEIPLSGDLKLHGVTRAVTLTVQARWTGIESTP